LLWKLTTLPPSLCLPLSPDRPIVPRVTLPVYLLPGKLVNKTLAQALEKALETKERYLVVCFNFSFPNLFTSNRSLHILTVDFRIIEERRDRTDIPTAPGKFEVIPKSTTSRSLQVVPASISRPTDISGMSPIYRSLSTESEEDFRAFYDIAPACCQKSGVYILVSFKFRVYFTNTPLTVGQFVLEQ
jgi:hypothetical protein